MLKKNLANQSAAHNTLLSLLYFSRVRRNELKDSAEKNRWMINNLLEVLVLSVAEYFYELCRILTSS